MNKNLNEVLKLIGKYYYLYDITKNCPLSVLNSFTIEKYESGCQIMQSGECCEYFYIVVYGRLEIYNLSPAGKKYTLSVYEPGSYLGELEIMDSKACVSSVQTLQKTCLLRLSRVDYLYWLRHDSVFNTYIIKTICDNMYELSRQSINNVLYPLRGRICRYLTENIDANKCLTITVERLSEIMGVTPRSTWRILRFLQDEEMISLERRQIVVLDGQRLAAFIE